MAAGLGFKDFVTGEVLTAADVDGYLMQGVWVFANAAARTAAVTSPQEGNMSYLKDTNSTEYYSGSAWVAIGGATPALGLTLISTTSFTGVASQSINNVFSSTYTNYRILVNSDVSTSADRTITLRLRVGGSDLSSAIYSNMSMGINSSGTDVNKTDYSATSVFLQTNVYYPTFLFSSSLDVFQPFLTTKTNLLGQSVGGNASNPFSLNICCNVVDSVSYTGFTLLNSSGNFTDGSVSVYGYNK